MPRTRRLFLRGGQAVGQQGGGKRSDRRESNGRGHTPAARYAPDRDRCRRLGWYSQCPRDQSRKFHPRFPNGSSRSCLSGHHHPSAEVAQLFPSRTDVGGDDRRTRGAPCADPSTGFEGPAEGSPCVGPTARPTRPQPGRTQTANRSTSGVSLPKCTALRPSRSFREHRQARERDANRDSRATRFVGLQRLQGEGLSEAALAGRGSGPSLSGSLPYLAKAWEDGPSTSLPSTEGCPASRLREPATVKRTSMRDRPPFSCTHAAGDSLRDATDVSLRPGHGSRIADSLLCEIDRMLVAVMPDRSTPLRGMLFRLTHSLADGQEIHSVMPDKLAEFDEALARGDSRSSTALS